MMIAAENNLIARLKTNHRRFHPVVTFNEHTEKLAHLDFSESNTDLREIDIDDVTLFSQYINDRITNAGAKFGFGGYNELRTLYSRSSIFNTNLIESGPGPLVEEPRRLHLGIDIWGEAGTKIFAPWGGMVHSFAFNDNPGDYGATIILLHQLEGLPFFTLYGHVSLVDLQDLREGSYISRGQQFAHFGIPAENGHWPPHLHFQVINDITPYKGDYPGVCKFTERKKYLSNCPDPNLVLNMH